MYDSVVTEFCFCKLSEVYYLTTIILKGRNKVLSYALNSNSTFWIH